MQKPSQHGGVDLAKSNFVAALPKGVMRFAQTPASLPVGPDLARV